MTKQGGRITNPPATDENLNYIKEYLQRKYGTDLWVRDLESKDLEAVNALILSNLSATDISRLRAAWRQHAQRLRNSAKRFPPVATRISGEAHLILTKLQNSAAEPSTMSDVIVEFLEPIAALSSSERISLMQQLKQRAHW